MMYLVLIFWAITLFDGGRVLWNGEFIHALAVVGASLLAFAAGSGFRGSLHLGNPKIPAFIIAMVILGASLALMHSLSLTVDLIDGKLWSAIGAVIGFLAARKDDALPRTTGKSDGLDEADARKTLERYQEAVVQLGAIMEKQAGKALPVNRLPLPKEEMKTALKAMWFMADDDYMKGAIEAGYSHLAYFRAELEQPVSLQPDVTNVTDKDGEPDVEGIKNMQGQLGLFQTVNSEAIKLAGEFMRFKASQA